MKPKVSSQFSRSHSVSRGKGRSIGDQFFFSIRCSNWVCKWGGL